VLPAILTVLRSGGEYTVDHVERLRHQVREHAPKDTPFICLTDHGSNPLFLHDWPGWWSKIEALRFAGPILYMDLDTHIVGDLSPMLSCIADHEFIALRDPLIARPTLASGIMAWRGNQRRIYERFRQNPQAHMARCRFRNKWGDQGFIAEDVTFPAYWQDLFPSQIVSWKVDCRDGIPPDARIVYFHGKPRPWDVGL